jgi:integrase
MTRVRLPYVDSFVDRHGHPHWYFRFRGKRWPLPAPGSPGFLEAYERLKKAVQENTAAVALVSFLPGSLGHAIEKLTGDKSYIKTRASSTRKGERRLFDHLRTKFGSGLLKDLTPRHIKIIRDEIRAEFASSVADKAVSLISIVWTYANEHLDLDLAANPTTGIKRVHKVGKGAQPWPQELLDRFIVEAPAALAFAVRLGLYTGQRRSDTVRMLWTQFDGETIEVRQQKTGELLAIPCHEKLRAELQAMPRHGQTILIGERGHSLTAHSLGVLVSRALKRMGVAGYSIHGL